MAVTGLPGPVLEVQGNGNGPGTEISRDGHAPWKAISREENAPESPDGVKPVKPGGTGTGAGTGARNGPPAATGAGKGSRTGLVDRYGIGPANKEGIGFWPPRPEEMEAVKTAAIAAGLAWVKKRGPKPKAGEGQVEAPAPGMVRASRKGPDGDTPFI